MRTRTRVLAVSGLALMGGLFAGQAPASAATVAAAPQAGHVQLVPAGAMTPQIRYQCEVIDVITNPDGSRSYIVRCT